MLNIFQSPWPLVVVAVITWMVLVILAQSRFDIKKLWQFLVPLIIIASAFGIDYLIKTDGEKIHQLITDAKLAIVTQTPDLIEPLIADDYSDSFHTSKDKLMAHAQLVMNRDIVEKITAQFSEISIASGTATGKFSFIVKINKDSPMAMLAGAASVKMDVTFEKAPNRNWYIKSSELTELNNQSVGWGQIK